MKPVRLERPAGPDWLAVSEDALLVDEITAWVSQPDCGATVTFCGTVRDHSEGRPNVTSLEYEAYLEHVEPSLAQVATWARERWPVVGRLALLHRIGRLEVGQTSVVVAVSTPHRAEAFAAAQFCIDTIKQTVPIWKRETWAEGADWVQCTHDLDEWAGTQQADGHLRTAVTGAPMEDTPRRGRR